MNAILRRSSYIEPQRSIPRRSSCPLCISCSICHVSLNMVKFYERIEPHLAEWAMAHAVFFVASAPLRGRHVNLSAKGLPSSSLSILNPNQCAYVDATGSGIETVSHLQENGRCTVMFCSFETSPRIMRFFAGVASLAGMNLASTPG